MIPVAIEYANGIKMGRGADHTAGHRRAGTLPRAVRLGFAAVHRACTSSSAARGRSVAGGSAGERLIGWYGNILHFQKEQHEESSFP